MRREALERNVVITLGYTYCLSSLTPVASRNLMLYQSLPTHMPYREAKVRRRKDDTRMGTAARGNVERLCDFTHIVA